MHLEEEAIQRWLHGEIEPSDRLVLEGHLAGCAECRGAIARAERDDHWMRERLRLLDHPLPAVTAPSQRRPVPWWQRWAAGFVLTVAVAGAAYAFPGSPLRSWLRQLRFSPGPEAPASPDSATDPARPSAVSIPLEPRLVIRFDRPVSATVIRVSLVEGGEVVVSSLAGPATFVTVPGRLSIDSHGATGEYLVELPRQAAWIAIEAGDARLLLKEGGRISTSFPADPAGGYVLHP